MKSDESNPNETNSKITTEIRDWHFCFQLLKNICLFLRIIILTARLAPSSWATLNWEICQHFVTPSFFWPWGVHSHPLGYLHRTRLGTTEDEEPACMKSGLLFASWKVLIPAWHDSVSESRQEGLTIMRWASALVYFLLSPHSLYHNQLD